MLGLSKSKQSRVVLLPASYFFLDVWPSIPAVAHPSLPPIYFSISVYCTEAIHAW